MGLDFGPIKEACSEPLQEALQKTCADSGEEVKTGLDKLASLTKRSEDVSNSLDILLKSGLITHLLEFFDHDRVQKYEGETSMRLGFDTIKLPVWEAVQLAACGALGKHKI